MSKGKKAISVVPQVEAKSRASSSPQESKGQGMKSLLAVAKFKRFATRSQGESSPGVSHRGSRIGEEPSGSPFYSSYLSKKNRKAPASAKRFKIIFQVVRTVTRLMLSKYEKLSPYELRKTKEFYDHCGGITSIYRAQQILAEKGHGLTMSECESIAADTHYSDHHVMTLQQFRKFFMYKKKELCRNSSDNITLIAFVALGGRRNGSGNIDAQLLREAVKNFGLLIDIESLIEEVDKDRSNRIEYGEFMQMFEAGDDGSAKSPRRLVKVAEKDVVPPEDKGTEMTSSVVLGGDDMEKVLSGTWRGAMQTSVINTSGLQGRGPYQGLSTGMTPLTTPRDLHQTAPSTSTSTSMSNNNSIVSLKQYYSTSGDAPETHEVHEVLSPLGVPPPSCDSPTKRGSTAGQQQLLPPVPGVPVDGLPDGLPAPLNPSALLIQPHVTPRDKGMLVQNQEDVFTDSPSGQIVPIQPPLESKPKHSFKAFLRRAADDIQLRRVRLSEIEIRKKTDRAFRTHGAMTLPPCFAPPPLAHEKWNAKPAVHPAAPLDLPPSLASRVPFEVRQTVQSRSPKLPRLLYERSATPAGKVRGVAAGVEGLSAPPMTPAVPLASLDEVRVFQDGSGPWGQWLQGGVEKGQKPIPPLVPGRPRSELR